MDFEGNVLSEPSQRRPYDLTYICNQKKGGGGSKIQQIGSGQKWEDRGGQNG